MPNKSRSKEGAGILIFILTAALGGYYMCDDIFRPMAATLTLTSPANNSIVWDRTPVLDFTLTEAAEVILYIDDQAPQNLTTITSYSANMSLMGAGNHSMSLYFDSEHHNASFRINSYEVIYPDESTCFSVNFGFSTSSNSSRYLYLPCSAEIRSANFSVVPSTSEEDDNSNIYVIALNDQAFALTNGGVFVGPYQGDGHSLRSFLSNISSFPDIDLSFATSFQICLPGISFKNGTGDIHDFAVYDLLEDYETATPVMNWTHRFRVPPTEWTVPGGTYNRTQCCEFCHTLPYTWGWCAPASPPGYTYSDGTNGTHGCLPSDYCWCYEYVHNSQGAFTTFSLNKSSDAGTTKCFNVSKDRYLRLYNGSLPGILIFEYPEKNVTNTYVVTNTPYAHISFSSSPSDVSIHFNGSNVFTHAGTLENSTTFINKSILQDALTIGTASNCSIPINISSTGGNITICSLNTTFLRWHDPAVSLSEGIPYFYFFPKHRSEKNVHAWKQNETTGALNFSTNWPSNCQLYAKLNATLTNVTIRAANQSDGL